MVKNWLTPYNFAFALSFLLMAVILPLTNIDPFVAITIRVGLVFVGVVLMIGTFQRRRAESRRAASV